MEMIHGTDKLTLNTCLPNARFPDGNDRYNVKAILAKEIRPARGRPRADGTRKHHTWYLIRWTGQSAKEDSWIREDNAEGCEELIQEFNGHQQAQQANVG